MAEVAIEQNKGRFLQERIQRNEFQAKEMT